MQLLDTVMTMPFRILLMGSSGQVGTLLAKSWAMSRSPSVDIVCQFRSGTCDENRINWSASAGAAALEQWIAQYGEIDVMIMLAGVTPGTQSSFDENVSIALDALKAAETCSIKRVLMASSVAVYGVGHGVPFKEEDPTEPVNDYGRSKLRMERECRAAQSAETELTFLRIGNVYGTDALMRNAFSIERQAPLLLDRYADGATPRRNYIGPMTMANVLLDLALSPTPLPTVLNIAHPAQVEMSDLADAASAEWRPNDVADATLQTIVMDMNLLLQHTTIPDTTSLAKDMLAEFQQLQGIE